LAGLRQGDRIVEVNGSNVESSTHKEVVEKIKAVADKVELLVIDADADEYFSEKSIKVASTMDNCVEKITCPSTKPAVAIVTNGVASNDAGQHPHCARLCVVCSWADGRGYGFSMQAQKGADKKPGQYIGKVEDGSPAELAGLRQGDRIVEVNGSNVESSTHKEVVEKIKAVADKVELLVVDVEADKYFSEKSIKVASTTDNCVEKIICPSTKPATLVTEKTVTVTATKEDKTVNITATKTTTEAPAESGSTSPPVVINGIEFAGSVQEARRRMSKKKSVTEDRRTMKDKYELFRKL
jgi:membrane-associated protease RseP (regulator of RpoE activity)